MDRKTQQIRRLVSQGMTAYDMGSRKRLSPNPERYLEDITREIADRFGLEQRHCQIREMVREVARTHRQAAQEGRDFDADDYVDYISNEIIALF